MTPDPFSRSVVYEGPSKGNFDLPPNLRYPGPRCVGETGSDNFFAMHWKVERLLPKKLSDPVFRVAAGGLLCLIACQRSTDSTDATSGRIVPLPDASRFSVVAETRQIVFGDGDRTHLLDGWSSDEVDSDSNLTMVWATERDATLSFLVLDVLEEQFLVQLAGYASDPPQRVSVLVNDVELASFEAPPMFLEYRFVAPARMLHRGQNRLTFRHGSLEQPSSDDSDPRTLAAAYHSILMGPQCLPLRGKGLPPPPGVDQDSAIDRRPSDLVLIGPTIVGRAVAVPRNAILHYRLALPSRARAGARCVLRVRDGADVRQLAESHLSNSLFGQRSLEVETDLAPWSGKAVSIEIEVGPESCQAPVATVVVDRMGFVESPAAPAN